MSDPTKCLTELLTTEHSKSQTLKIVNYVADNQKHFDALFHLFTTAQPRIIQRAAWAVNYCVERQPAFLSRHFEKIVDLLDPSSPAVVKRNCTRLLQFTQIPNEWRGHIFDRCFSLAYSAKEPIAVRCFGMQVLYNISLEIPELKHEVAELLEDLKEHESPGIRSRVRRLISGLKQS